MIIFKDETGKTKETRVPQDELVDVLKTTFTIEGLEVTAVVKV